MQYNKEKQILVSLISSPLILGSYSLYVYQKYVAGNPVVINDFKFWGKAILILIPVSIIAHIIIHIIFVAINKIATNEDVPTITDERDKLIELKGTRVSHWTYSLGFLLSMGSIAIGMQPYVMFILLMASFFVACCAGEITKIVLYRKGF